jgi:carbon storage regulator
MLVLTRRTDEKIVLPTVPAVIKVVATQAGSVRLGIEAPEHVPILREELYQGEEAGPVPCATLAEGNRAVGPAPDEHALCRRVNALLRGLAALRDRLPKRAGAAVREAIDELEAEAKALRYDSACRDECYTGAPAPHVAYENACPAI